MVAANVVLAAGGGCVRLVFVFVEVFVFKITGTHNIIMTGHKVVCPG